jgi:hypothetical protein
VQSVASPNGTFRHDTGPSLLLFPDKYQEAFEGMGTSLQEQGIKLARVQPAAYRVWFAGGGGHLDLLNDEAAMAAQLEAVEPGAADGYRCGVVWCPPWAPWLCMSGNQPLSHSAGACPRLRQFLSGWQLQEVSAHGAQ